MTLKEEGSGKPVVAPLDIPDDLKGRLPSAKSSGRRPWVIIGVIAAIIICLGLWQLLSDSGPVVSDTVHPNTTFGK